MRPFAKAGGAYVISTETEKEVTIMNRFSLGGYTSELQVAGVRGGWVSGLVAFNWFAFPFALASLLHPGDVVNLHYVLQGDSPHKILTAQQICVGFVEAVFAIGILLLLQLVGVVLFYRRAQVYGGRIATPALWPVAGLLPGAIGNALWFVCTQQFDVTGLVIGLSSMGITLCAEQLCEKLGRDFVFGPRLAGIH
jgi:hypothetical protein